MPKQIRNPKTERALLDELAGLESSAFWSWAEPGSGEAMALREDAPPAQAPRSDLMERTAPFGEAVVRFVKRVPLGPAYPENNRLVDQLVGAGTSIGANYCEADDAVSSKDFRNKIGTCRKESKESMFFLRMLAASEETLATEARSLWREAKELNLIFGLIWRKTGE